MRAVFPRAFLDANREPFELDPRMFEGRLPAHANTRSLRVAAGLGTIARLVAESQEIYARRLPVEAGLRRIEAIYRPYHGALRRLTQRAQKRFGLSVLVDCHSMPSIVAGTGGGEKVKADFVLGDRYGTSCDPESDSGRRNGTASPRPQRPAQQALRRRIHHRTLRKPRLHAHALQIEVNRGVYMNEATFERSKRFEMLTRDLTSVVAALSEAAHGLASWRAAAE